MVWYKYIPCYRNLYKALNSGGVWAGPHSIWQDLLLVVHGTGFAPPRMVVSWFGRLTRFWGWDWLILWSWEWFWKHVEHKRMVSIEQVDGFIEPLSDRDSDLGLG